LLTQGPEPVITASWLLRTAAALWSIGSRAHRWAYQRDIVSPQKLPRFTVSIGGITAGGTGKTPLSIWLAGQLKQRGLQPAFLTRGYRRQGGEAIAIVPASAKIPAVETGDEAQILVRSGLGPVCIGADRHAAATKFLLAGGDADVFLLDDGLQHHRLERDFDIVVLDALDPLAGGRLLPAGRLREPANALARANAVVLTRTEPGLDYDDIRQSIRQFHPTVPIFTATNIAGGWFDLQGIRSSPSGRVMAFCGLGNPISFWKLLDASASTQGGSTRESKSMEVAQKWELADHHLYGEEEVQQMAAQALAQGITQMVTTEKDAMNLPSGIASRLRGVTIHWLKLDFMVDQGEALVRLVCENIPRTKD
jgi:tetraacyldisaccharide 4'-kinase